MDHWRHALNEKKDVGVAAIYLPKAFDCIIYSLQNYKHVAYKSHSFNL